MMELKAHELLKYKNWVVVGDVAKETKYAHKILDEFKIKGYNVRGVSPRSDDSNIYKSLRDIPGDIDAIDLCINSILGVNIVKEVKELGIKHILIQPGAESREIMDYCNKNGINAVVGCALIELSRE